MIRETRRPSVWWLLSFIVLPVIGASVRYRIRGVERVPMTGPVIIAPNHFTEIDPLVFGLSVWKRGRLPHFLIKRSLTRLPIVGWILRKGGNVPVDRDGTGGHATVRAAGELMRAGGLVIVYPEGSLTRDPDLWPMRGKTGAVRIALEHGIPVIPAAHWGTQAIMARYGRKLTLFRRKPVDVIFGEPVDLSAYEGRLDRVTLEAATADVMAAITDLLAELRGETPPADRWDPVQHRQRETGRVSGLDRAVPEDGAGDRPADGDTATAHDPAAAEDAEGQDRAAERNA